MARDSSPEVYNSRGLVSSSRRPGTASSSLSGSSLDSSTELCVPGLFLAASHGMSPQLAARAGGGEVRRSRQLARHLANIFRHALQTGDLDTGLELASQFSGRPIFSICLLNSLSRVCRREHPLLPSLLIAVCLSPDLAALAGVTGQLALDKMVDWVARSTDSDKDLREVRAARELLAGLGSLLADRLPQGLLLLYQQVGAGEETVGAL